MKMETIFGLLRKRQIAIFSLVVASVSIVAWGWACKINYMTTYTQLLKVTPKEAAIMFTMAIQSFEFLVPVLAVLGIAQALKVSRQMVYTLFFAWFVVIGVDFMTALQYFLAAYEDTTIWAWALSIVLAGTFLVAEMLLVLSVVALYVSYKMLRTGTLPGWISNPEQDHIAVPDWPLNVRPRHREPVAQPAIPAVHSVSARPDAKTVPDGTVWIAPTERKYVTRNGEWIAADQ